jgi:hypothetical protein
MPPPLQLTGPLSLGDLLDGAFRLYRSSFRKLVPTAAIFLVPVGILSVLLLGVTSAGFLSLFDTETVTPATDSILGYFGALAGVTLLGYIASGLAYVSMTAQVLAITNGEEIGVVEGIRRGLRRFLPYIGMMLLAGMAVGGIVFATYMAAVIVFIGMTLVLGGIFALTESTPVLAIGMTLLALMVFAVVFVAVVVPTGLMLARWIAAPTVVVAEEQGPMASLGRSWQLTRRRAWRGFGLLVLIATLNFVILGLPTSMLQWTAMIVLPPQMLGWLTGVISGLAYFLNVLWYPFLVAALVLIYLDLRVRAESYDLELRIRQLEESVRPTTLPEG